MHPDDFSFETTQSVLRDALAQMLREPKLFDFRVNERTLTQRLAFHLQLIVGRDLSVDCEYNRMWIDDDDLPKRLPWPRETILSDDDEGRTVYPDIILHIRGQPGATGNVLVIEAKRNHTGAELPEIDRRKLEGFTNMSGDFGYRWGLFLNFRLTTARKRIELIWYHEGAQCTNPEEIAIT